MERKRIEKKRERENRSKGEIKRWGGMGGQVCSFIPQGMLNRKNSRSSEEERISNTNIEKGLGNV